MAKWWAVCPVCDEQCDSGEKYEAVDWIREHNASFEHKQALLSARAFG